MVFRYWTKPSLFAIYPASIRWRQLQTTYFQTPFLGIPSQATLHSFLSPLNIRVDEFNQLVLGRLSGEEGK